MTERLNPLRVRAGMLHFITTSEVVCITSQMHDPRQCRCVSRVREDQFGA
jgi:hypothetical protein